ncbi:MAG: hypothetical protein M1505_01105 [Patescibacteria group bacterium]|nr:hypothetical protein [Patescibacteria group bacterium]
MNQKDLDQKLKKYLAELNRFIFQRPVKFDRVKAELSEHFSFIRFIFKRVLVPIIAIYMLVGLIFHIYVLDSLALSIIAFLYSNFLPDFDMIFKQSNNPKNFWSNEYLVLFFAPIYLFYIFSENVEPPVSKRYRPFHRFRSFFAWGLFLLFLGFIFYRTWLEKFSLLIFGLTGYFTHLLTDESFKF